MAQNWWEYVAAGLGTGLGFVAGLPVGQPILGAGLGYKIGTDISPGGFQKQDTPEMSLRQPASADITAAAIKQMEAQKRIMGEQVASSIEQERISRAGRGMYSTGAGFAREGDIRQGGMAALSSALAQTGLQAQGLQQQGAALGLQQQMQQAQMLYQKQQTEAQLYGNILEVVLPFFMKKDSDSSRLDLLYEKLLEDALGVRSPLPSMDTGGSPSTPASAWGDVYGSY